MLRCWSSGMPGPLSRTSMRTVSPRRRQPERELLFARRRRKGALDSLEQAGDGKLRNLSAENASVELRDIEQGVEQLIHRRDCDIDPFHLLLAFGSFEAASQLFL